MDNLSDEEFEAAMNEAIANDTGDNEADAVVDEVNDGELDDNLDTNDTDSTKDADKVDTDDTSDTDDTLDDDGLAQNQDGVTVDDEDKSNKLEQPDDGEGTKDSNDDDTDGKDKDKDDETDSTDGIDTTNVADKKDAEKEDDNTDDQTDKPEESDTKPEEQAQLRKIKADGVEYEFSQDEMDALAQKGINYTKKLQAISPWRKTISALESENMTHEDVNLMVDALKGDKEAIASMLKRTGVEAIDLDTDSETDFKPKDYGKSTEELDIEEITNSISQDKEYAITHNVISKQWDDASRDAMFENPTMIAQLHTDVQSGMYDKVAPIAMKMKIFGNGTKSDIDYYKEAGAQVIGQMRQEQADKAKASQIESDTKAQAKIDSDAKATKIAKAKADEKKRVNTKNSAAGRKSAATTKSSAGTKGVIDYLDMDNLSDDEFSAMMDKEIRKK